MMKFLSRSLRRQPRLLILLTVGAVFFFAITLDKAEAAPALEDEEVDGGCYYMFNHYGEGDRIMTNEPCLNCTCHNSMLMCYLRVCPFTKPIGQDCVVEKRPDQCCPVINCPEVPVSLVTQGQMISSTSTTTVGSVGSQTTALALAERGCEMDGTFYPNGAQISPDPTKPCELCYCIRNRTACVMQECILHVEGCEPIFQPGVCCPVRYQCDIPPRIETTTNIIGLISTTMTSMFISSTPQSTGCYRDGEFYADGSQIPTPGEAPCEHCYCMRGEIVCAVQECGSPMEGEGENCTAIPPKAGLCCPEKYQCQGGELDSTTLSSITTTGIAIDEAIDDVEPSAPPRPVGAPQIDTDSTTTEQERPVEFTTTPDDQSSTLSPESVTVAVTETEQKIEAAGVTTQEPSLTVSDRTKDVSLATSTEVVPEASTVHLGLATTLVSTATESTEKELADFTLSDEQVTTTLSSADADKQTEGTTAKDDSAASPSTTIPEFIQTSTPREEIEKQSTEEPSSMTSTETIVETGSTVPAESQSTTQTPVSISTQEPSVASDQAVQTDTEEPKDHEITTTQSAEDVVSTQTTLKYTSTVTSISDQDDSGTEKATTTSDVFLTSTVSASQEPAATTSSEFADVTEQIADATEASSSPASLLSSSAAPIPTDVPTTEKEVTESVTDAATLTSVSSTAQPAMAVTTEAEQTEAPGVSTVQDRVDDHVDHTTTSKYVEVSTTQVDKIPEQTEQPAQPESTETSTSAESRVTATEAGTGQSVTEGTATSAVPVVTSRPVDLTTTTAEDKYVDGSTQKIDTESLVTSPGVSTISSAGEQTTIATVEQEATTSRISESSSVVYEDQTEGKVTTSTVQPSELHTQGPAFGSTSFDVVTESGTTQQILADDQAATTQADIQAVTPSQKDTSTPQPSLETEATESTEFASSTVSSVEQLSSSTVSEVRTTQAEVVSDEAATTTSKSSEISPAGVDEQGYTTTAATVFDKSTVPVEQEPQSMVTEKVDSLSTSTFASDETTTPLSSIQTSSEASYADEQPSSESTLASTEKEEQATSTVASTEKSVDTTQEQQVTEFATEKVYSTLAPTQAPSSSVVTESVTTAELADELTEKTVSPTIGSSEAPANLLMSSTTISSVTEVSTSLPSEGEGSTIRVHVTEQETTGTESYSSSTPVVVQPDREVQGTSTEVQADYTTVKAEIEKSTEATTVSSVAPPDSDFVTSTEREVTSTSFAVTDEKITTEAVDSDPPQTTTSENISTSSAPPPADTQAPLFDGSHVESSTTEREQAEATTVLSEEHPTTSSAPVSESSTVTLDEELKQTTEEAASTTLVDGVTPKVQVIQTSTEMEPEDQRPTTSPSLIVGTSSEQTTDSTEVVVEPAASTSKPLDVDLVSDRTTSEPLGQPTTTVVSEDFELSSTTEAAEITSTGFSRIPGEGSCFVEGVTYKNGSRIPPSSPCQIACACQNSIVHCLLVHCPPPPTRFGDCKPIYMPQTCCPKYDCDVASSSPGSVVTPVSQVEPDEDKVIVTPEPSVESTPAAVTDSKVLSDETSATDSSQAPDFTSTEKATESTSQQISDDATVGPTSTGIPETMDTTAPSRVQTVEPIEATQAPVSVSQTEGTEAPGTTTSPVHQTEPTEGGVTTTSSPVVEVTTSIVTEFDNETSTTPLYPVTVSTTVTPSPAAWPYPSQTTTPAGMSTGACLFDSRVYMSAQQILRDDPCDFCFCFRGDIICLQQSCPPPIPGCYEEPIPGFCCPRYECPVGNSTTASHGLLPPSYYHNQVLNNLQPSSAPSVVGGSAPGCEVQGEYYEAGQKIKSASGPCLECRCGENGMMNCDPRECQPEPMLRKMIEAISS